MPHPSFGWFSCRHRVLYKFTYLSDTGNPSHGQGFGTNTQQCVCVFFCITPAIPKNLPSGTKPMTEIIEKTEQSKGNT